MKKALKPDQRKEGVGHLQKEGLSQRRASEIMKISRSAVSRPCRNWAEYDAPVIDGLNKALERNRRWGFWKCYQWMRNNDYPWNHKRVHRVYCEMKLNLPRRTKRRIPTREKISLEVSEKANDMWSMDFMHDRLYCGKAFRTSNILDEGVQEALAIEVDTSLPAERVVRVLEQLSEQRKLPRQIRVDNGPELISERLSTWCEERGIRLAHIQRGKPMQNAFIERFNRTFRHEVLDAYLFESLDDVRECHGNGKSSITKKDHTMLLGAAPKSIPRINHQKTTPKKTLLTNGHRTGKLSDLLARQRFRNMRWEGGEYVKRSKPEEFEQYVRPTNAAAAPATPSAREAKPVAH